MAKIVHVTSVHVATDTRILYRECASLVDAGHDVTLIAVSEIPRQPETIAGVKILWAPVKIRQRAARVVLASHAAIDLALAQKADLYHLHDPELLLWTFRFRQQGARLVFDMHEYLPGAILDKAWIPGQLRPFVRWVAQRSERLLLRGASAIFAEDSYRQHYPWIRRWVVVRNFPNVADISRFRAEKSERFSVGYVGGVTQVRGSATMIRAIGLMQDAGVEVDFECIGPTSEKHRQQLDALVAELGVQNIRFHGRLKQLDAMSILATCHAGLAILQDRPNYRESYPTKMFEYMALGIPVVVSDFPLNRKVIVESGCGFSIPPDDPQGLALILRILLENPQMVEEMSRNGMTASELQYNWQIEVRKLLDFYESELADR